MFTSSHPAQTVAYGRELAAQARPGDVWALTGDLGAGKTHFVQGAAAGLGSGAAVTSPTFSLVHEYPGGRLPLFHFDFYRLRDASEALAVGMDEYLAAGGLTIIEWAGKFPQILPATTLWLHFTAVGEDVRKISRT